MEFCISRFKRESGIDITNDKRAVQRLRKQCEMAKRTLSTQTSASVDCEALANGVDFSTTVSRAKFEELNQDLFKKTMIPVTQVLKDAGMSKTVRNFCQTMLWFNRFSSRSLFLLSVPYLQSAGDTAGDFGRWIYSYPQDSVHAIRLFRWQGIEQEHQSRRSCGK